MQKNNLTIIVSNLRAGGQERVATHLSNILKDDFNIKMIIIDGRLINYDINCEYYCINIFKKYIIFTKIINAILRIIKVRKIKKEWNTDICISFGTMCDYINAFSKLKDKIYLSIRGYLDVRNPTLFTKCKNEILYSKANGVICVSKRIVSQAKIIYPRHKKKFKLLYNPCNIKNIQNLMKIKLSNYSELFNNNNVIISVGTFRKEKGYWHLVKAFYLIKQNNPNYKLFILGAEYLNYKNKLISLIKNLNLIDSIILSDFDNNPFKYLNKAKVYVLSSIFEGFPNALIEAMSCGLPVIATDCNTGPREILSDNNNNTVASNIEFQDYGILVPPLTETENYNSGVIEKCDIILSKAIELLINNNNLAIKYSKYALLGVKRYTENNYKENLINILK